MKKKVLLQFNGHFLFCLILTSLFITFSSCTRKDKEIRGEITRYGFNYSIKNSSDVIEKNREAFLLELKEYPGKTLKIPLQIAQELSLYKDLEESEMKGRIPRLTVDYFEDIKDKVNISARYKSYYGNTFYISELNGIGQVPSANLTNEVSENLSNSDYDKDKNSGFALGKEKITAIIFLVLISALLIVIIRNYSKSNKKRKLTVGNIKVVSKPIENIQKMPEVQIAEPPVNVNVNEESFNPVEEYKKSKVWFIDVQKENGEHNYYDKDKFLNELHTNILKGTYSRDNSLVVYAKTEKGIWQTTNYTIGSFAKNHFKLNILFKPVWEHAISGLKWGAIVGAIVKLLDTLIGLFTVNPVVALLFLAAVVVCFIPRIGIYGIMIISFIMVKFSSMNFFLIGLVAALTGAILGCLPGMAIGCVTGLIRKKNLPRAADSIPEPDYYIITLALLPFISGIGLIAFYFYVFNPWLIKIIQ